MTAAFNLGSGLLLPLPGHRIPLKCGAAIVVDT